jgi:putative transposase
MAVANPLWGAPRIHGELGKLGLDVSERTVSRLLRRRRRPPSQTWRTFLTNHLTSLVSLEFFTVPTVTGRVLFVLVLLAHHRRRRIVHLRITEHHTAAWTAQQLIEAFPEESAPRWFLRDRDAIYGDIFRGRVAGMGIQEVISAPSSPWQNPYVERVIGSIRRECLNHVIVINELQLRRTLAGYLSYYHRSRTHLSLAKDAPTARPVQAVTDGDLIAFREIGG